MRLFIAVEIPEELKAKIASIQDRLDQTEDQIKPVGPENLHFNLKFIGEFPYDDLPKLKVLMDKTLWQFDSFNAHIHGIGTFPTPTFIKVIWLGMTEGEQALSAMAESLENALESLSIAKEEKPFKPHLTLGRLNSRAGLGLISLLKDLKDTEIGSFKIEKVILFESKLTPKGPIYTEVHHVKLR